MNRLKFGIILILILITSAVAFAQNDNCAAIVRAAVEATNLECANLAPGQVCYGNAELDIDPPDDNFSRPGRVTDMGAIDVLTTSAMDSEAGQWGVALAQIQFQANPPAQIMTVIALGDVTMENLSESSSPVLTLDSRVTFARGANVRVEPSENSDLAAQLTAGQRVPATGRLADGSWLRIYLPDSEIGWVSADLIAVEGDLETLPVVMPDDDAAPTTLVGPWQIFDFHSGINDSPCNAAPNSGIVIQAADGSGEINLVVNGVDIAFAGTVYLQARDSGEMSVTAIEDNVRIVSAGVEQIAIPGTRTRLRWDADQTLLIPRDLEYYEYVRIYALPLSLLPRPVDRFLVFNLIDVATPAALDPLTNIVADSSCTVAAFNDEGRLRMGPGREYPIVGGLRSGESANPDARAVALDGTVWWRLREGIWARVDVVLAVGNCGALPTLQELPPIPVQSSAS